MIQMVSRYDINIDCFENFSMMIPDYTLCRPESTNPSSLAGRSLKIWIVANTVADAYGDGQQSVK